MSLFPNKTARLSNINSEENIPIRFSGLWNVNIGISIC